MGKRSKEIVEEAPVEEVVQKKKKKSKEVVEEEPVEEVAEEVAPKKKKKGKKAEEVVEEEAVEEAVPKRKKKKSAAVEEEAAEEPEAPPKKKKKSKAVQEEETAEEEEAPKNENKKKPVVEEADDEDEGDAAPTGGKSGNGKSKGKEGKFRDTENTVMVRGLPYGTVKDVLEKDFTECGKMLDCRMPLNEEGGCKGIAFVKYETKDGCDAAIKFDQTDYGGRTIYVSMAGEDNGKRGKGKDGKDKGGGKGGVDNENTVFVRGLPFTTTEELLKKDFAECGEIVSLKMPLEEGSCRGIAFVKYASKEACDKAIEFNDTDYGGRTIMVQMAGAEGGKGKDGKGKGKDGKGKKGKKGKGMSEAAAKSTGAMVESTGKKQSFDSDSDE